MFTLYHTYGTKRLPAAGTLAINLDTEDARQLAHALTRQPAPLRPHIVVDCSTLKCLRTLGVSHVVSQLLVLHQSGANVWLRNVSPTLRHCLQLLRLDPLFIITD